MTVAPTGGFLTKRDTPHVPTQPEEIAEDVYRCYNAGASVAALHARRPDDEATCDPEIYRHINRLVRERCDIVVNNSTGGGLNGDLVVRGAQRWESSAGQRALGALAGAEMCSFNAMTVLATVDGREVLMSTSPAEAVELATTMRDSGVKPEWEVFSPTHLVQDVTTLIEAGYDEAPHAVNFCFGLDRVFQGAMPYSPRTLQYLVDLLPAGSIFTVSGHGAAQLPATTHALLLGGHIRVGLEDNIRDTDGELRDNVHFVEKAVRLIRELGLEPATPAEARQLLGLTSAPVTTVQNGAHRP
ncbi:BKACE family enzyme [Amycolatopsis viridis]|uniref:Uncharacterized protein (DUF849 family) n=1 Tax=Amycolatopsis viridis TaxID=185678 RepID=A0ABX0SQ56_9PSEU|nr:3-keto-5-aminohexanoate cleavage protein [Amycolatopsis viridis]NIH79099.1 uncharacterized protein (DUF849 family) [Amycolatopsis viridis]